MNKLELLGEMIAMSDALDEQGAVVCATAVAKWGVEVMKMQAVIDNQSHSIEMLQNEDVFKASALNDMQDTITSLERMLDDSDPVEFELPLIDVEFIDDELMLEDDDFMDEFDDEDYALEDFAIDMHLDNMLTESEIEGIINYHRVGGIDIMVVYADSEFKLEDNFFYMKEF